MPRHLHLDFETFSEADLKSVGAYRYAYDPSTEILCAAMSFDDRRPIAWWQGITNHEINHLNQYFDALEDPAVLIYAHNAMFEMAVCQVLLEKTWNIKCPDLSRFRCTMSLARRAALPASLDKLGVALGLKNLKDAKGKTLLRKFSVMQKAKAPTKKNPDGFPPRRIMPADEPELFAQLVKYCCQDVVVERDVAAKLKYFDEPINNANYSLDAVINARGVTVNLGALEHAQKLIEEETAVVGKKFRELTGFNFTQDKGLKKWLAAKGEPFPNLQAETIESFLEEHEGEDSEVVQALKMKQATAYASIKKVATMLACRGPHDNRIRGMLNHHGATTGRWTNSLVQFQNMKRPTLPSEINEQAYWDICGGISREMLDLCYGPPLEVIGSCIRHFVQDTSEANVRYVIHPESESYFIEPLDTPFETDGCAMEVTKEQYVNYVQEIGGNLELPEPRMLNDADYAAIEARIVAWLAGQKDALEEYRQGVDRYKRMASFIYGVPEEEVNKFPQRFVGKQATLGCGFGMGAPKFRVTCKKMGNYDLPLGLEDTAVTMYRAKNKKIVSFWYDTERAAKRAIVNKGSAFQAGKLTFLMRDVAEIPFLLMQLPSKRKLAYPRPKIVDDRIYFYGKLGQTQNWGDVTTWGGTLVENATQAVAADVMAQGAHNAERKGYEIATLIHDQALAYHKLGQTPEEFVELLTDMPSWADGLPIAAEGALVSFYKKG